MKKDIFTVILLTIMAIIGSFLIYYFTDKKEIYVADRNDLVNVRLMV